MEKGYPQRFWIIAYTSLRTLCCHYYSLGHVNEIINVNGGLWWWRASPKASGSLPIHLVIRICMLQLLLGTLFTVILNINGIQIPVSSYLACNNDFEANSTSLMSLWANIKFFPEPTGELYGWLLETLVIWLFSTNVTPSVSSVVFILPQPFTILDSIPGHHQISLPSVHSYCGQQTDKPTLPKHTFFNTLTLTVLNFWKFTSCCSLKPLWLGMGEVVPARTSPTLHSPIPSHCESNVVTSTLRVNFRNYMEPSEKKTH